MKNSKSEIYAQTAKTIFALVEGEADNISKMATIACELFHAFNHFHWVGFYRNTGNNTLKIGPYQGSHGCITIAFSRGVCGACATSGETQIVADVNTIENHIACSSTTRSEIVLPVWSNGRLIAVLDIDSDELNMFDEGDRTELEKILQTAFP